MSEHSEEEQPAGQEPESTAEEQPPDEAESSAVLPDLRADGPRFAIGRGSQYGDHEANGTPRRGLRF